MNASTLLLHILLDNGLYLDGWSRDEIAKLIPILEAAGERVIGKVAATEGEWTKRWLMSVKADLDAIYRTACDELSGQLMLDLKAMTSDEAQRLTDAFGKGLPGISFTSPGAAQLWAAVTKLPVMEGSTIGDLLASLSADLSSRVVSEIQAGIIAGDTNQQMVQRLRGKYNRSTKQYEGGVLDSNSAKQIVRTATMHVGNQAREAIYEQNADIIKGYQRVETLDLRTCPICGLEDGRVYGLDEPRPQLPAHFNCLTGDTLVSSGSRVTAVGKRIYKGDMFIIRTASGNEIRATPNHPILTDIGFTIAKDIRLGNYLVCDRGIDRVGIRSEDDNQTVARIEDLFCSFFEAGEMSSVKVPTTSEDFHGDGIDNEVAIIAANRELLRESYPTFFKEPRESNLILRRIARPIGIAGLCCKAKLRLRFLASSCRAMGSLGNATAFLLRHAAHSLYLLFMRVSFMYSGLFKGELHIHSTCAKGFGDPPDPDSGVVNSKHFRKRRPHLGAPAYLERNATGLQASIDGIFGYADLASDLINGLAGPIFCDKVVEIRKINFSGHVYSLQSEDEYFIANNILTHNCRGLYIPVLKSFRELGFDAADLPPSTRASMDGQVAEFETYRDWLAKTTDARRIEALGPGRAALYKQGVGLDEMVRDGKLVPLKDLRAPAKKGRAA